MCKKEVSGENRSAQREFISIVGLEGGDRQFVNAVDKNLWEYVNVMAHIYVACNVC